MKCKLTIFDSRKEVNESKDLIVSLPITTCFINGDLHYKVLVVEGSYNREYFYSLKNYVILGVEEVK